MWFRVVGFQGFAASGAVGPRVVGVWGYLGLYSAEEIEGSGWAVSGPDKHVRSRCYERPPC